MLQERSIICVPPAGKEQEILTSNKQMQANLTKYKQNASTPPASKEQDMLTRIKQMQTNLSKYKQNASIAFA